MRQRSQSMKTPEVEESEKDSETKVEDILKNNIKLWKAQQNVEEESDSVFESESSEEERLWLVLSVSTIPETDKNWPFRNIADWLVLE